MSASNGFQNIEKPRKVVHKFTMRNHADAQLQIEPLEEIQRHNTHRFTLNVQMSDADKQTLKTGNTVISKRRRTTIKIPKTLLNISENDRYSGSSRSKKSR